METPETEIDLHAFYVKHLVRGMFYIGNYMIDITTR